MRPHRNPPRILPMSLGEFAFSAVGSALTIYVVGLVMGVQWL